MYAYPNYLQVILNISNITDFLSFVSRKLNETNTFFLCLVVRDGDYTLEGAVSPIINLSLQSKLLPTE